MTTHSTRRQPCSQPDCTKKSRAYGLCNSHRWELLGTGEPSRRKANPRTRTFTHGKTAGAGKGCTCAPCKQARRKSDADSLRRRKDAVRDGTYDGPHGARCARLGCTCPLADAAKEESNRIERERRAAQGGKKRRRNGQWADRFRVDGKSVTVMHYPPRGTGLWECPTCGQSFPHRPLLDQQPQAA